MRLTSAKCPNCGADIKVNNVKIADMQISFSATVELEEYNSNFKRMYEEKMSKLREWEVIPCA